MSLGGGVAWAGSNSGCGDDNITCASDEKCCEHRVATFCKDEACSNVRREGQCIPRDRVCGDFWCGNRQCQMSWLLSKDVCCIYYPGNSTPEYACTASELSCPGNNTRLSIRPTAMAN